MRNQAPDRQQQDVDFRMAKEPEQMLEQDGITAAGCIEEMCAEMPVGEQHGDRARQHWQGCDEQECGD